MFGYYTTLLIITLSIVISVLIVIYYDDALNKVNKNVFFISYIIILIINIFEWLAVYLEATNSSMHFVTTFFMGIVLFLAPSITAIITWGIRDKNSIALSCIVFTIILLCFIVGFSGLFTDAVFYYDEQNVYHRGEYFFIQIILAISSSLLLLINTFRIGIKYQNNNNYILVLNFCLFMGALFIQFIFDSVWLLWLSYMFAIGFTYIYYSSLVNQIDVLTGLLNRKCYESQIYNINTDAIILIFDVNKFKEINDTHGHAIGDYCLKEIASAIKKVYSKSGYCYRIGGDEFSVILHKNLDSLECLNSKLTLELTEGKYKMKLPTVSIGYSHYYPNISNVQEVIESADKMMYALKQENNLTNLDKLTE